jgi:hypothetical protein
VIPANDDIAGATTIDPSALPFTHNVAIDDATTEARFVAACRHDGSGLGGLTNVACDFFYPGADAAAVIPPNGEWMQVYYNTRYAGSTPVGASAAAEPIGRRSTGWTAAAGRVSLGP